MPKSTVWLRAKSLLLAAVLEEDENLLMARTLLSRLHRSIVASTKSAENDPLVRFTLRMQISFDALTLCSPLPAVRPGQAGGD